VNEHIGVPSDNTTLTAVLAEYEAAGFAGQFEVISDSAVGCLTCGEESAAAEFCMAALRRLEGASDPDDMLSVVAISCPRCQANGTLVLGYGPNASAEEAAISKQLRDQRGEGSTTPPSSPGT
jgi:hypothetical protein